jgi:hypothetical protein
VEAELQADGQDLRADDGEYEKQQLHPAALPRQHGCGGGRDGDENGHVPEPRHTLEEARPARACVIVEPVREPRVHVRVALDDILGHGSEDPRASGEDD